LNGFSHEWLPTEFELSFYFEMQVFVVCAGVTHLPLVCTDMKFMRVHFGPSGPVIFLTMSAEFGKRIRGMLGMTSRATSYYDPESAGMLLIL
jgi:hypothetical protein